MIGLLSVPEAIKAAPLPSTVRFELAVNSICTPGSIVTVAFPLRFGVPLIRYGTLIASTVTSPELGSASHTRTYVPSSKLDAASIAPIAVNGTFTGPIAFPLNVLLENVRSPLASSTCTPNPPPFEIVLLVSVSCLSVLTATLAARLMEPQLSLPASSISTQLSSLFGFDE